jgi:type II secretory pathway component PulF
MIRMQTLTNYHTIHVMQINIHATSVSSTTDIPSDTIILNVAAFVKTRIIIIIIVIIIIIIIIVIMIIRARWLGRINGRSIQLGGGGGYS